MMSSELLELAAKAAGIKITLDWLGHSSHILDWYPLDDDGEAFRLAVKLGINPQRSVDWMSVTAWYPLNACGACGAVREQCGQNPYAATRLAIVRAAAELGRRMSPGADNVSLSLNQTSGPQGAGAPDKEQG